MIEDHHWTCLQFLSGQHKGHLEQTLQQLPKYWYDGPRLQVKYMYISTYIKTSLDVYRSAWELKVLDWTEYAVSNNSPL